MDWLRRNWADVAIGTGLVAVLAGIALTLVTGGSFFPSSPSPTPRVAGSATQPSAVAAAVDPTAAVASPDAPAPEGAAGAVFEQPAGEVLAPVAPPIVTAVPVAPVTTPAVAPAPAVATPAPTPAAVTPAAVTPAAAAPTPATPTPAAPTPARPAAAAASPIATPAAPRPAAPIPAASRDPSAPFRVSVGAFTVRDNAVRQSQTVQALGYPVFIGEQDGLSIVLVGPFDDLNVARSVSERLATADLGVAPIVYRFQADAGEAGDAAAARVAAPAATPAPRPAASPAPAVVATANSGRSLQVHAVGDPDAANREVDRLRSMGYPAYVVRENALSKVLVGPFDEATLATVRQRLGAEGISSFPR